MKSFLFLIVLTCLLMTVMPINARAEWNPNSADLTSVIVGESHKDTLVATENDTMTFAIADNADVLCFQIATEDAGIISAKYRVFANDKDLHRGGSSEPVSFIQDGGTTTTSLTVAADGCYTATVNPLGMKYQQLIITSNATIKCRVICVQANRS